VCAFLFEVISVLFFNVDTLDFLQIILAGWFASSSISDSARGTKTFSF
jgi:hypothetical protein